MTGHVPSVAPVFCWLMRPGVVSDVSPIVVSSPFLLPFVFLTDGRPDEPSARTSSCLLERVEVEDIYAARKASSVLVSRNPSRFPPPLWLGIALSVASTCERGGWRDVQFE